MGQQLTPLRIEQVPGTKFWDLTDVLAYRPRSGEVIETPAGFRTDLQSIPGCSWSFVGHPADDYAATGANHDDLYKHPHTGLEEDEEPRSRRRCDQIFLEFNCDLGCPWWKRTVKYSVVRAGGWRQWKRYRETDKG